MTRSNAKDWFRENIGTVDTPLGEALEYVHSVDGCNYCPESHEEEFVEHLPLDVAFEFHGEAMEDAEESGKSIPEKAVENVKEALLNDAETQGTGHERFFEQA